ncbi:MAG TPA: zinc-binding dehydrogenase, partial [Mycobacterium sp.]|nr:zinc-binding dehydrogenase [Mycobacterium sp.]
FDQAGTESDGFAVLNIRDVKMPDCGSEEVVVRTALAPINPSDLLFVANKFPGPTRPVFPGQVAGISGAGYAVSDDRGRELPSKRLFHYTAFGTWSEYVSVPADSLIELPSDYPLELAAQFSNVVTAWQLIENSGAQPGQWLALTAGYSTVASIALQFAVRKDINVISVVRKRRPEFDLTALGAAAVLAQNETDADMREMVMEATSGQGVSGVIDCVTGNQLGQLIRACAPFSRVQLYGCLDESNLDVTGPDLMYSFVDIAPYSYPFSFSPPTSESDHRMLRDVIGASADGRISVDNARVFPLDDFRNAVDEHLEGKQPGKIFLGAAWD